jgi:hypothetical protein
MLNEIHVRMVKLVKWVVAVIPIMWYCCWVHQEVGRINEHMHKDKFHATYITDLALQNAIPEQQEKQHEKNVSVTWENITLSKNDSSPCATISNAGDMKAQKKQHANKPPLSVHVVSLQGVTGAHPANEGRLDNFSQSWREMCGSRIQIRVCRGELDPRRGYGLTKTYVKCLQQAIEHDGDYSIFLEDDARLITSEFCDSVYRDSILSESRSDGLLVLLNAHGIKYGRPSQKRILPLTYSLGSYGFMVPRENLISLRDHFSSDLLRGKATLSPDISWYDLASHIKKHIYIISPVAIKHMHMKGVFSNTWNRPRG